MHFVLVFQFLNFFPGPPDFYTNPSKQKYKKTHKKKQKIEKNTKIKKQKINKT